MVRAVVPMLDLIPNHYAGPNCVALLSPPISLTTHLLPLIGPRVDIKIKHGSMGLLKHLAQPPQNKDVLGKAGLIEALSKSGIWKREADMAEMVQMSAIGIAKHLAYGNGELCVNPSIELTDKRSGTHSFKCTSPGPACDVCSGRGFTA